MNKPEGKLIISIDDVNEDTRLITHSYIEIYDKSPLKGLARKYVPKAGDRIYIYPDSNIPRFKLKRFCDAHKVFIAKAKETANVFFMDPKTANLSSTFYRTERNAYLMNKDYFTNYIKKATTVNDPRYSKLLMELAASPQEIVHLGAYYSLMNKGLNKYKLDIVCEDDLAQDDDGNVDLTLVNCEQIRELYLIHTDEQKTNFAFLEGKDFYHPDALLALLNEGSVLDKEMYEGVMNLFGGTDPNDHKIAMEAMANCDYQKSAVYLLMTFYHHRDRIHNCDTKHHVNFKSFLNFFDLKTGNGIMIDDIIDRLKDKRLLDSSNLAIVMREAKKIIKENIEGQTDYFMFTEIAPIEEIRKEVEETDAEIAAALIPPPVVEPEPVIEEVKEEIKEEIKVEPTSTEGLSHL